jgi:hypothetical protein
MTAPGTQVRVSGDGGGVVFLDEDGNPIDGNFFTEEELGMMGAYERQTDRRDSRIINWFAVYMIAWFNITFWVLNNDDGFLSDNHISVVMIVFISLVTWFVSRLPKWILFHDKVRQGAENKLEEKVAGLYDESTPEDGEESPYIEKVRMMKAKRAYSGQSWGSKK